MLLSSPELTKMIMGEAKTMFTNLGTSYDGRDATLEILILLLGSFLLGMLLSYLLVRSRYAKKNSSLIDKTDKLRPKRSVEDLRASFRKTKKV